MKSFATFGILLSLIGPALATPNPEITAPAVLPRQLSTTIVGYFTRNGSWNSVWCNSGYRYCTQGSYAACGTITESACNVGVSCLSTSLYVDTRGVTSTCSFGTDIVCGTNTVFQKPGDTAPATSIVCRAAGAAGLAVYRSFPDAGLGPTSSSGGASSTSISSTLVTSTSSTQNSASSTSATSGSAPAKSKAWIAGPVVGGLVVLVAIIFGCILLRRRKAKKTPQQAPPMQQHQPPVGFAQGHEKKPEAGQYSQQYYDPHSPQPYGQSPQAYGQSPQPYTQSPQPPYAQQYSQPAAPPIQQQPVHELGPRY